LGATKAGAALKRGKTAARTSVFKHCSGFLED